jgi:hypothetical protein
MKKILLMFIFLLFSCICFTFNSDILQANCCSQTALIFTGWSEYDDEAQCPNSAAICSLRYRLGRTEPGCQMMCLQSQSYGCVPSQGDHKVICWKESCLGMLCVTTRWIEWEIEDTQACDPYTCFDRCTVAVAKKQLTGEDCDEETSSPCLN